MKWNHPMRRRSKRENKTKRRFRPLVIESVEDRVVLTGAFDDLEGAVNASGVKFFDENSNGIRDGSETGIEGLTVFVDDNDNGQFDDGEICSVTDANGNYLLQLQPGTYTIRAETTAGRIITLPATNDSYSIMVESGTPLNNLDFGEADLEAPISIDLQPSTDSGVVDDDLTNFNNASTDSRMQFQVSGVRSGAQVYLFSDGSLIGTATATGDTVLLATDGMSALTDGDHDITASQFMMGVESPLSNSLTITIDLVPPASIDNTAPDFAQAGQLYSFDANSPDEGHPDFAYTLFGKPSGMTIDQETGLVEWTPTVDQVMSESFEIVFNDLAGNSTSQVVQLVLLGVIPAFDDIYSMNEDESLTIGISAGVLDNDGDLNSGMLTANVVVAPVNGIVVLLPDGSFVYTPDPDFSGSDTFTYTASDNDNVSNVATVTVDVSALDDPVTGNADIYSVSEDGVLSVTASQGVLVNDTEPDNDPLSVTVADDPANGTLTMNTDGSFGYSPDANFNGIDSFTYNVSDGNSSFGPYDVSINVMPVADTTVALPDSYSIGEDGVLSVDAGQGVLTNDSDPDGDLTATIGTQPTNGTVTFDADGSFVYTPSSDFNGTDTFTYTASDGISQSTASVTLTVNSVNDAPTAADDTATAANDGSVETIDVLSNDSDPDSGQTPAITAVTQGTQGGTVTLSESTVTYTADTSFSGTDTFTYTIEDPNGLTDEGTVTVTVTESASSSLSGFVYIDANNNGVRDDGEIGVPGTRITLTGEDSSGEAVNRTFITTDAGFYRFDELAAGTYQLTETHPHALVDGMDTTNIDGAVTENDQFTNIVLAAGQDLDENNFGELSLESTYISITWFFASAAAPQTVFREMVAVGEELAGNDTLAKSIRNGDTGGVNSPPVAFGDSFDVDSNGTLTISATSGVLSNDSDAEDDSLTAELVQGPNNGTLSLDADGSFTFSPSNDFSGDDSFTYTASDGFATSNTATVSITVNASDNPVDNVFDVSEDIPVGTSVGTVTTSGTLSSPLIYEIDKSIQDDALTLYPNDHRVGPADAKLVLIEYLNLQCPACAKLHPILLDLQEEFEEELLIVQRHFVRPSDSMTAVIAAEAAALQGEFQGMIDLMFTNQANWSTTSDPQSFFDGYAQQLGLDMDQFEDDLDNPAIADRIQRDLDTVDALGLTATPSLFLEGREVSSSDAFDDFEGRIESELDDFDAAFVINRDTGEITKSDGSNLNDETSPVRQLTINVTDNDGTTEEVGVTINVLDADA